jgi:protein-tyrosine phosphatase
MTKVKVLFVCLGNICRSPLAEAVFKHKITAMELDAWVEADSCGTANYHVGDMPDSRTIANAAKNGVVLNHLGRQLSAQDIDQYDFILGMDRTNHANILKIAKGNADYSQKIMLMRKFDPQPDSEDVPDPYYGTDRDFQHVFEILDRSMESFIAYLKKEHFKV